MLDLASNAIQRELKFVFPNSQARLLRNWLTLRCAPDPTFAAGRVFTVYFDTPEEALLDEKINSDYLKTKVRLRWYGDWTTGIPAGQVYLEVKKRIGSSRAKFRKRLGWTASDLENMALEDPRLLQVNQIAAEAGFRFAAPLRPVVRLEYLRHRYLEPAAGTRICLDHDILPARFHAGTGRLASRHPIPDGVFEIKGADERMPETLHPLIAMGCRRQSFSKFQRCMGPPVSRASDETSGTRRMET